MDHYLNSVYSYFCAVLKLFLYSAILFLPLHSQESVLKNNQLDITTSQNSSTYTSLDSSLSEIQDSTIFYHPLDNHGSLNLISQDFFRKVNKKDLQYLDYHGFSEMLSQFIPSFPMFLGVPGMYNNFSFFGAKPDNTSYTFNGHTIHDPSYPSFNPEQFAAEFFENIEILIGSDAVVMSDNASGALINYQEIKYNTKKPYTRLWFSQGGQGSDNYLSTDGIHSQNFFPNMNYTFGFRRQSGFNRYENSKMDSWNVRNMIRWNPADLTSFSLVHYFSNQGSGLNGGSNYKTSIDDEGKIDLFGDYARVNYSTMEQRVFRHDLSINLTSYLSVDSTTAITGSLFISNAEWNLYLDESLRQFAQDSARKQMNISKYYGGYFRIEQSLINHIFFRAGAEAYYTDLEKSVYNDELKTASLAAFGQIKLSIFNFISLTGGLRLRNYNNKIFSSQGIKLNFDFAEFGKLRTDLSISPRIPSPSEGLNLNNETHILFLNEYSFNFDFMNIKIGAFFRKIQNPVTYKYDSILTSRNGNTFDYLGEYFEVNTFVNKNIFLEASIYLNNNIEINTLANMSVGYAKISSYYEIISGRSIMRLGISGKAVTPFNGAKFLPQYRIYAVNDFESNFMYDGLTVFAHAKLGETYVKASFENVLFRNFYYVPAYPVYSFNFRFSLIWTFLD